MPVASFFANLVKASFLIDQRETKLKRSVFLKHLALKKWRKNFS